MITKENSTGIILAGGKSTRMKEDKGLVMLKGTAFVQHIINALDPLVQNILIITNNTAYQEFGHPCYTDIYPDCGPLGGLYTGLYHTPSKYNYILSCDIPFITTEVLKELATIHDNTTEITIAQMGNQLMPLVGIYNDSCKHAFLENIKTGKLKVMDAVLDKTLQIKTLGSGYENTVANINTQQDLKKALL